MTIFLPLVTEKMEILLVFFKEPWSNRPFLQEAVKKLSAWK